MSVKVDLSNIEDRIKFLEKDVSKALMKGAQDVVVHLKRNWLAGKGGDEKSMKALSTEYKARKVSQGGNAIPDMVGPNTKQGAGGQMMQALKALKRGKLKAVVTFLGSRNINVARGNLNKRHNMMKLSDKIKKKVIKNFYKDLIDG